MPFFQVSDFFQTSVCTTCGEIGTHKQTARGRLVCHVCHRGDTLQTLELPYAAKLLTQELRSMGSTCATSPRGANRGFVRLGPAIEGNGELQ